LSTDLHHDRAIDCVQTGVLVQPLALGTAVVTGKDRQSWLNGMVTCELASRRPGDAALGLLVTKAGKIQSELYVLLGDDDLWIGFYADRTDRAIEELDRHLIMEDAEIERAADGELSWLLALGLGAEAARDAARAAGARAGLVPRGGLPVAVIAAPAAVKQAVIDAVLGAASPSAIATAAAWDRVRVEHGITAFGIDFDDTNYPQEASLERDAVSFEKGCYLGQEAVFMLEKRGHVKKRIVQLHVEGAVERGDTITLPDGAEVGHITSRALRRAGGNLALGFVKYKHARADTELRVGASKAVVTSLLAVTPST
jgi:hypothetical protein